MMRSPSMRERKLTSSKSAGEATIRGRIGRQTDIDAVFEYDQIDIWGPELKRVLASVLPKHIRGIFAADPPDDVEHAREILLSHMQIGPEAVAYRIRCWLNNKRVAVYVPLRLTDAELERVLREGLREDSVMQRGRERIPEILKDHRDWNCVQYRLEDALANTRIAGHPYRKAKIYASASRNCLLRNFDDYPSEASIVDERISYELLGKSGAELAHSHGNRVLLKVSMWGGAAVRGAKACGKAADPMENLVRETFESFCYWLADPEFQPGDECLYIGVQVHGVSVMHILGAERVPELPKR